MLDPPSELLAYLTTPFNNTSFKDSLLIKKFRSPSHFDIFMSSDTALKLNILFTMINTFDVEWQ